MIKYCPLQEGFTPQTEVLPHRRTAQTPQKWWKVSRHCLIWRLKIVFLLSWSWGYCLGLECIILVLYRAKICILRPSWDQVQDFTQRSWDRDHRPYITILRSRPKPYKKVVTSRPQTLQNGLEIETKILQKGYEIETIDVTEKSQEQQWMTQNAN